MSELKESPSRAPTEVGEEENIEKYINLRANEFADDFCPIPNGWTVAKDGYCAGYRAGLKHGRSNLAVNNTPSGVSVEEIVRVLLDVCAKNYYGPEMEALDYGQIEGLARRLEREGVRKP